jgi:hypothetical protein
MKVVLDTNIMISGTFWNGDSNKIFKMITAGEVDYVVSQEILNEYYKVLCRDDIVDKIEDKNLVNLQIVDKAVQIANKVNPTIRINIIKDDPSDNKILECAITGRVKYIITNDQHLLKLKAHKTINIITPKDFLKKYKFK